MRLLRSAADDLIAEAGELAGSPPTGIEPGGTGLRRSATLYRERGPALEMLFGWTDAAALLAAELAIR